MKIYVASSWRNEARQQAVVQALRKEGHEVYDFRNPAPGDHGFSWTQIVGDDRAALKDARRFRDEVLTHPIAQAAFDKDMGALRDADATVIVLPCGRSAHLELGWGARNARSVVLLDDPMSEPELMYLACNTICVSIEEVVHALGKDACTVCHGANGGVPGNENIVNGVLMCDYCTAADMAKVRR